MQEKLLQKPPPKYIYDIIINVMNVTEFPKGLFTDEELNPKHFDESPQNKIEFLQKAIDITKIVINDQVEVKPKNIRKFQL
jgi:TRAF3-interacting protein 1